MNRVPVLRSETIGGGVALVGVVVLLSVLPRNRDRLEKEKLDECFGCKN